MPASNVKAKRQVAYLLCKACPLASKEQAKRKKEGLAGISKAAKK